MVLPPGKKENIMSNQKHLTLDSRITIETLLNQGNNFKYIAAALGKDCTTISKEIKKHIFAEKSGSCGRGFNDCLFCHLHQCKAKAVCKNCTNQTNRPCWTCGKCINNCILYQPYTCIKLSKAPYVCNGCPERYKCALEKKIYKASFAHEEYQKLRTESRMGFSITETELKVLDDIISPLLKKGQSLHHISIHHADELMKCERTLYSYVNSGLFTARNIDMPRTVRMRPRKNTPKPIKVDKACRINRNMECFLNYLKEHPDLPVRQIDSVEGIKGGAVLLTIHFVEQELQLAFLRPHNNSQSVINIFNDLYLKLGTEIFADIFPILLADNGSEFSNPTAIEFDSEGIQRTRIFYCNANAPYEKANCENNHEMIRRIIPKGIDIGKYSQEQIDLMMSHINSYARKNLGNKTPYDVFAFQYGEEILKTFHLRKIPADEITLTPKLLKDF